MTTLQQPTANLTGGQTCDLRHTTAVAATPLAVPAGEPATMTGRLSYSSLGFLVMTSADVLLVIAVLVIYIVLRMRSAEVFDYGVRVLDLRIGAISSIVLALSGFSMAWAVHCAPRMQRVRLFLALLLTLTAGAVFLGARGLEQTRPLHEGVNWTLGFRILNEPRQPVVATPRSPANAKPAIAAVPRLDATRGRELWMATCRACHGMAGEGIAGQGKDIRGSSFIADRTDSDLVSFIKVGRMPFDKLNTTGIQMPPKGGNPMLRDDDLANIVAYVRTFKAGGPEAQSHGAESVAAATSDAANIGDAQKEEFYIPKSVIPAASVGPAGLLVNWDPVRAERDRQAKLRNARPFNAHLFFNIYALMTGVQGLHVVVGMLFLCILALSAFFGRRAHLAHMPIQRAGMLWYAAVALGLVLFPLLYLVR